MERKHSIYTIRVGVRKDLLKIGHPLKAIDGSEIGTILNVKHIDNDTTEIEVDIEEKWKEEKHVAHSNYSIGSSKLYKD